MGCPSLKSQSGSASLGNPIVGMRPRYRQKEIICESGLAGLGNFSSTGEAMMMEFGKILVFFGVLLLVLGALFLLLGRTSLPIGRLPGDILYRGKNTTFYFPFTTSILLSAVLSLVLYVIGKFKH